MDQVSLWPPHFNFFEGSLGNICLPSELLQHRWVFNAYINYIRIRLKFGVTYQFLFNLIFDEQKYWVVGSSIVYWVARSTHTDKLGVLISDYNHRFTLCTGLECEEWCGKVFGLLWKRKCCHIHRTDISLLNNFQTT
jgi:hypothetical protein